MRDPEPLRFRAGGYLQAGPEAPPVGGRVDGSVNVDPK